MTAPDAAGLRELLEKDGMRYSLPLRMERHGEDDFRLVNRHGSTVVEGMGVEVDGNEHAVAWQSESALALIVGSVNNLGPLLDRLEAQKKVLDLVRETEAPGGHHRLRRLHEELEDAWTALERLEAPDGR